MKNTKSLPLTIVATSTKFTTFYYDRLEIDYIKKYSNVLIWDLSFLSSKSFYKSISAAHYEGSDLKVINSYKKLISEILFVKKNYDIKNIFVMNFVAPNSLADLIFLFILKKLGLNTINYDNAGLPTISISNIERTTSYVLMTLMRRSLNFISKILKIYPTHCIYAGNMKKKNMDAQKKNNVKYFSGNTWDYNNIIIKNYNNSDQFHTHKKTAVLLDTPGPMFGSDSVLFKTKDHLTSEIWYPALISFFKKIEKMKNIRVDIAGHPKTLHPANPSYFGNRNVLYGKTLEIVRDSDFVITRESTAISYAIIFKKPVIFIYSNQLKKDNLAMSNVNTISTLLGTVPINIDDDLEDFSGLLNINESCYEAYKKNYLTSNDLPKKNSDILLEDIMFIKT